MKYRLIYYLVDPFNGWQVPIAAISGTAESNRVVIADYLPSFPGYEHEQSAASFVRLVVERVRDIRWDD